MQQQELEPAWESKPARTDDNSDAFAALALRAWESRPRTPQQEALDDIRRKFMPDTLPRYEQDNLWQNFLKNKGARPDDDLMGSLKWDSSVMDEHDRIYGKGKIEDVFKVLNGATNDAKFNAFMKTMGPRPAGNKDIWTSWDEKVRQTRESIYGNGYVLE